MFTDTLVNLDDGPFFIIFQIMLYVCTFNFVFLVCFFYLVYL